MIGLFLPTGVCLEKQVASMSSRRDPKQVCKHDSNTNPMKERKRVINRETSKLNVPLFKCNLSLQYSLMVLAKTQLASLSYLSTTTIVYTNIIRA